MMGRGGNYDESQVEAVARIRERMAGVEQKLTHTAETQQRELASLRAHIDERFSSMKSELKSYIDQKFTEIDSTIVMHQPTAVIDPRFWLLVVVIGLFSAGTFVSVTVWLILNQGG